MPWLLEPADVGEILGTLLTAQAAIVALSLAVTLFMMQGVRSRGDVDDRMYREFVRRSWMREILWGSLLTLGVTSALLLLRGFIIGDSESVDSVPEFRNYVLVAGLAFFLNLFLVGTLFERAIRHSRPDQWLALRQDVNRSDVHEAVRAFLGRARRAADSRAADEQDLSVLLPDPGEGSADEAVRSFLDDARKAMLERRHVELRRALDSVRDLIIYAIDEIKITGVEWGTPGAQAEWPPLRELSRNLYSFREDVLRERDKGYLRELLGFDYWLAREGMRERCGELFTVGLDGYRWNYEIAGRTGGAEIREMLRDQFSQSASAILIGAEPVEAIPYARELIRLQERLLSDAMHSDRPNDFGRLHEEFMGCLEAIGLRWRIDGSTSLMGLEQIQTLRREYRIALMGLGGRALDLATSQRVTEVAPFLSVAQRTYSDIQQLAGDLASALSDRYNVNYLLWKEWERESARPNEFTRMSSERYPLTFFALRLMELASDVMPSIDLHGKSKQALDWFESLAESIASYVHADAGPRLDERREFAREALRSAVCRDEVAEDYEIIGRDLSEVRISTLKTEVYTAAFSSNVVEQLFERSGARVLLSEDAADAPDERAIHRLEHKGFLTDTPEGVANYYAPLDGEQWGWALSDDVLRRLCESLVGAPENVVSLETPTELLKGIDRGIDDLDSPEHLAIVLAGNWSSLEIGLSIEDSDSYEASWKLPESDRLGVTGFYRGYPILSASSCLERCVYVVEPAGWGQFVRSPSGGDQDIRIEIKSISSDRARELLVANPEHFASQPDEESKLRKLQTHVEMLISARTGFRVSDPTRARRLVPIDRPVGNDEASEG